MSQPRELPTWITVMNMDWDKICSSNKLMLVSFMVSELRRGKHGELHAGRRPPSQRCFQLFKDPVCGRNCLARRHSPGVANMIAHVSAAKPRQPWQE